VYGCTVVQDQCTVVALYYCITSLPVYPNTVHGHCTNVVLDTINIVYCIATLMECTVQCSAEVSTTNYVLSYAVPLLLCLRTHRQLLLTEGHLIVSSALKLYLKYMQSFGIVVNSIQLRHHLIATLTCRWQPTASSNNLVQQALLIAPETHKKVKDIFVLIQAHPLWIIARWGQLMQTMQHHPDQQALEITTVDGNSLEKVTRTLS
jgi:hypothetical protein